MNQAVEHLEERLSREIPAFSWHCQPAAQDPSGALPKEIEVHVWQEGVELTGSPLKLNENLLRRWGVDSTARLICREFRFAVRNPDPQATSPDWDKLSDV